MNIHLGFEIGTGKAVEIPCRHMVVTGQTQEAGKTTTLEALVSRSGLKAVAFVTKRGEQSFANARRISPYFRERADWQFVASVLEATMRERLKFERAWIMRASKGARSLANVQDNVRVLMRTAKGLSADVYMTLDAYLEIVVPRVRAVNFAKALELSPGLNVVDMSDVTTFPPELQSLVICSSLEWVHDRCQGTVTIIPEAWEFIPQGRGSPVKSSAIALMRKGAGLGNYVWPDSQDIGGVDKEFLRQCPVYLIGVQREANEIKRTLANIPDSIAKPKAAAIATLKLGEFFACWGQHVIKTYVQPEWMETADAVAIAMGEKEITSRSRKAETQKLKNESSKLQPTEDTVTTQQAEELQKENQRLRDEVEGLKKLLRKQDSFPMARADAPALPMSNGAGEELYQAILARLMKEPVLLKVLASRNELEVAVARKTLQMDETSAGGMIAILLGEGFLASAKTATAVWKELQRRWNYGGISARCYEQLDKLTALGFVTKEADGYLAVHGMKVNIIK